MNKTLAKTNHILLFFFATLILHIAWFIVRNHSGINFENINFQQDNYVGYTQALRSANFPNNISDYDSRLFPGLPFLIYLADLFISNPIISGLLVSLVCLYLIYWFSCKITGNSLFSFIITLFPPIILELTSKISTETVIIAIFLISYYLLKQNKYLPVVILSGFGFIVRQISICLFLAIFFDLLRKKQIKRALYYSFLFLLFPIFLAIFNQFFWPNEPITRQFITYINIIPNNFGFIQLILDIGRTISWGQWRILISGLLYLLLSGFFFRLTLLNQKEDPLIKLWITLMIIFAFAFGPVPFLEDMRRYLAVIYPLMIVVNYKYFLERKKYYLLFLFSPVLAFT